MTITRESDNEEWDDRVRIRLGTEENVRVVETYEFHTSILQQPSKFALTLSGGRGAAALLRRYLPGPKAGACSLSIGKYRQFTGELDAVNAVGDANRTNVQLIGRDLMARLHDSDIPGDRSFDNATYEDLFKAGLLDVGLQNKIVEISNTANRKIRSGVGVKVFKEPVTSDEVKMSPSGNGKFRTTVTAKMGESWLQLYERQFAKLGLFPWSDAYGNFVLSRPNADQEPLFHFYRRRGPGASKANVKRFAFTNDTTHRVSELVIFARNLGRKMGQNHTNGGFIDEEMKALGHGKIRVYRDAKVNTPEEAEYFARKQIAEANRAGWRLTYTVSGHSAPRYGVAGERAIVVPDVVARIDDDELNIHENLYIESVIYRSPPRECVITFMRPQDLIFGEFQAEAGKKKAKENTRKMLSFVRLREPVSFEREKNAGTNVHRAAVDTVERKSKEPLPSPKFGSAMNK
jgi:prophage tail gpP-like protein